MSAENGTVKSQLFCTPQPFSQEPEQSPGIYFQQLNYRTGEMAVVQLSFAEICRACMSRENLEPLGQSKRIETLEKCVELEVGLVRYPYACMLSTVFSIADLSDRWNALQDLLRVLGPVRQVVTVQTTVPEE